MQGRLELSSPEATCLLAARKKRKSLVLYHILVYNKHIIIDWMHILSPCHLTNDSLNTPFQDWFIHGIILNKKVTVARGHLASREEGRMLLLAVPARNNGSAVWTGKMVQTTGPLVPSASIWTVHHGSIFGFQVPTAKLWS